MHTGNVMGTAAIILNNFRDHFSTVINSFDI